MPGKKSQFFFQLQEQLGEPAAGSGCLAQELLYECTSPVSRRNSHVR